jgi:hypothetical protein
MTLKSISLMSLVLLALAVPARGQDAWSSAPPRGYLTASGGAAFDTNFEHPATSVAVEYGERLHRDVQAYAMFSYVENLMSTRMRSNLTEAGITFTQATGVPWEFRGRDRGLALTVGGKFLMPIAASFRPYVGGGLGVLNLRRRISERDLGDVSESFVLLTGLNDGVIDADRVSATKPLGEVVLGAGGAAGRAYFDIAYRYRKAFHSFEQIHFSQVTAGVGLAF